jgi:uncharacterized protein (TIGR02246 family)
MKTKNLLIVLASMLFIIACTQKPVENKDKELVESLKAIAVAGWGSGDITKLMNLYTDDAVVISGKIKMNGKDSISSGWSQVIQYAKNFNAYQCVYSVSEDMVYVQGYYIFDWTGGASPVLAKGTYILVWKKQADNSWKITFHQEDHGDIAK